MRDSDMIMIATHNCVCVGMECGQIHSQARQTQNEHHALLVVDLKSCWFSCFSVVPPFARAVKRRKRPQRSHLIGHKSGSMQAWEIPRRRAGKKGCRHGMNHALRYFISLLSCFVRRNKKGGLSDLTQRMTRKVRVGLRSRGPNRSRCRCMFRWSPLVQ